MATGIPTTNEDVTVIGTRIISVIPGRLYINNSGTQIPAGPFTIWGYDPDNLLPEIKKADLDFYPANGIILSALDDGDIAWGYPAGDFTSGLDTTGSAIGAPVFLARGGGISLSTSAPYQIIGRVASLSSAGLINGFIWPLSNVVQINNAASGLVQLDGSSKLPAVDGSLLTNLPAPTAPGQLFYGTLDGSGYYDLSGLSFSPQAVVAMESDAPWTGKPFWNPGSSRVESSLGAADSGAHVSGYAFR